MFVYVFGEFGVLCSIRDLLVVWVLSLLGLFGLVCVCFEVRAVVFFDLVG